MASSVSSDDKCIQCVKALGTFTCRGCGQNYCTDHANEHRQNLLDEMDQNVHLHDHLHEQILQKINHLNDHPSIKDIELWEQNSIELIHQTANNLRKDLFSIIEKPIYQIKRKLENLTEELKEARNSEQFFENDLKEWINKLNQLSNQLNIPLNINLNNSNDNLPLIPNIKIDYLNECFQQPIGNMNIIENGSIIVHNDTNNYASVRGCKDYYQGEHLLHFQILNLTNNWIFIGIVSKDSPIPDYPSIGKTAYGWSGLNNVWQDGIRSNKFQNYQSDFQVNDQLDLIINCDQRFISLMNQRFISLMNQRNHLKYQLDIDINSCLLPWKLSLGLFHAPGESILIL